MSKINNQKMIGFQIKTVDNLLKRSFKNLSHKQNHQDLTGKQRWIIRYIAENKEKDIFQKDIEEEFSIRRSTGTGILKLMEKNGLIVRESVPYDARLKKLVLTPEAIEIENMTSKEIKDKEELLRKGISEEELKVFFEVIEKIKKNLED